MKLSDSEVTDLIEQNQFLAMHSLTNHQRLLAEKTIHALSELLRLRKAALVEAGK
jgi:hypothetical protein